MRTKETNREEAAATVRSFSVLSLLRIAGKLAARAGRCRQDGARLQTRANYLSMYAITTTPWQYSLCVIPARVCPSPALLRERDRVRVLCLARARNLESSAWAGQTERDSSRGSQWHRLPAGGLDRLEACPTENDRASNSARRETVTMLCRTQ